MGNLRVNARCPGFQIHQTTHTHQRRHTMDTSKFRDDIPLSTSLFVFSSPECSAHQPVILFVFSGSFFDVTG
jgi:hypothetical protein